MTTDSSVTVLGLGDMGSALAGALLAAGRATTVWNRTPGRAMQLVERGAIAAETVEEALVASELVVVCLLDHASVHAALDQAGPALVGRVLVNLTNGTPGQARELAGWAHGHGATLLDGGIMAVPPMIGTPAAFVLYSGQQAAFEEHRGTLDVLGESRYVGEDPGLAALQDLALLSGMYGMIGGVLHAYALVGSGGVAAGTFAPLLRRWLTSMGGLVDGYAEQIDAGDYARGVVSNVAMQAAAYPNHAEAAREQGISPALIPALGPLMQRRVSAGHGHEDLSGLIELLKEKRDA